MSTFDFTISMSRVTTFPFSKLEFIRYCEGVLTLDLYTWLMVINEKRETQGVDYTMGSRPPPQKKQQNHKCI